MPDKVQVNKSETAYLHTGGLVGSDDLFYVDFAIGSEDEVLGRMMMRPWPALRIGLNVLKVAIYGLALRK